MKRSNKGFTLIELLAVIVILAIIALIATPIVLNLIEKARKGAAQDSAYGIRKSAQLYYSTAMIDDPNGFNEALTFTCGEQTEGKKDYACKTEDGKALDIEGTAPSAGTITISAIGEISTENIVINGFSCPIADEGTITCADRK